MIESGVSTPTIKIKNQPPQSELPKVSTGSWIDEVKREISSIYKSDDPRIFR